MFDRIYRDVRQEIIKRTASVSARESHLNLTIDR